MAQIFTCKMLEHFLPGCMGATKIDHLSRPFRLKLYTTSPRWKVALREEIDDYYYDGNGFALVFAHSYFALTLTS